MTDTPSPQIDPETGESALRSGDTILVTGGLGFIGSAVVRALIADTDYRVVNLDKVSYASTTTSVETAQDSERYSFQRCDLADDQATRLVVERLRPQAVLHLAAETHVDRSIDGPRQFLDSNVIGTFNLLEAVRACGSVKRFVHVSTDEVFGSLAPDEPPFDEASAYDPRSPYSASKAAADHMVRAWGETYDLPVSVTSCSNNYGPYQFPEKLIPLMIVKAARGQALPVYGQGTNVRDWLHVEDHATALLEVLQRGRAGRTYAIGGNNELTNIEVVRAICRLVDEAMDDSLERQSLIEFVADRPGHDLRYGIDGSRIRDELGWSPSHDFPGGLATTVRWYLDNEQWWGPLLAGTGGERLGLRAVC